MSLSTSDNHAKLQTVAEEFQRYLEQREIGKDYERTLKIYYGQIDPTGREQLEKSLEEMDVSKDPRVAFISAFEFFKDRHRETVERYPDFPRRAEEFEKAFWTKRDAHSKASKSDLETDESREAIGPGTARTTFERDEDEHMWNIWMNTARQWYIESVSGSTGSQSDA